jgi:FAD-dependent oxidoreductase domain-containing protein 1
MEKRSAEHTVNPQSFDKIIIGGEVMGSSMAYHLVKDGFRGRIAVFEKNSSYERTSTVLSAGGVRR